MHKNELGKHRIFSTKYCLAQCPSISQFSLVIFSFQHRYDRHREQILRGSDEYSDDSLDVFQYFTASCYRGFDDGAGGFYAVYKDVFEKLAAEDIDFMDNDDEIEAIPGFGNVDSDYEKVVGPFYAYWSSYCTKKSYAWLCPHNVTEIRDRRILRHIEKDTKKIAQKAKRERNDEVRALVAFVKKRDKRVIKYRKVLEEKAELNRVKQQEKRLQQIRSNMAEAEEMRRQQKQGVGFGVDHEAQLRQLENAYRSDSDDVDSEDDAMIAEQLKNGIDLSSETGTAGEVVEEVYIDHLYCVACNKSFKNESSMRNHEPSKKHRDNIERLRLEMLEEQDAYDEDEDDIENSAEENSSDAEADNEADQLESSDIVDRSSHDDAELSDCSSPDDTVKLPTPLSNRKNKKKTKVIIKDSEDDDLGSELIVTQLKDKNEGPSQKQKKSKKKAKKFDERADDVSTNELPSAVINPIKNIPVAKSLKKTDRKKVQSRNDDDESSHEKEIWSDDGGSRKTKKATKKAKRAVAPMAAVIDDDLDVDHTCVTCKASFDSKNKLFTHLKQVGHGVFIDGKGIQAARTIVTAAATKSKGRKK